MTEGNRGKYYNVSSQKQRRRRQNGEKLEYTLNPHQALKEAGLE